MSLETIDSKGIDRPPIEQTPSKYQLAGKIAAVALLVVAVALAVFALLLATGGCPPIVAPVIPGVLAGLSGVSGLVTLIWARQKNTDAIQKGASEAKEPKISDALRETISKTPKFSRYRFADGSAVTGLYYRPANLFFRALFGRDVTTMPGKGLFRFTLSHERILRHLLATPDTTVFNVTADGFSSARTDLLGKATFRISGREIKELLDSQRIYISPLMPKPFYLGLKEAFDQDLKGAILPGTEGDMRTMKKLQSSQLKSGEFLKKVATDPTQYGFVDNGVMLSFDQLMSLTVYQLGSMVVKTEDYHCLVEKGFKIRERQPNANDTIKLINACGIRGFAYPATTEIKGNEKHQIDRRIMKYAFKSSFEAARDGYLVTPAVGMGVWGGDPGVYWQAFLDAVIESDDQLEHIFINPGHQKTPRGPFRGKGGEELATLMGQYRRDGRDPSGKLDKIVNLYQEKTDVLFLALNLKIDNPGKTVSLFNASDPDVTLGNHVGEYTNNRPHQAATTEEHYTALGTNGLCFEGVTNIRGEDGHPRVIQCR